eukprot:m.10325 g.10325  ORF g.10325 m.10325 type:complete len:339 (+) comp8251_c0_seq2:35-1051(+)
MAKYFGGIDGGATKSIFMLYNQDGTLLAKSEGKGTNYWLVKLPELLSRINILVTEGKVAAGIDANIPLASLGLSLSGADKDEAKNNIVNGLKEHYPNTSIVYDICTDTYGGLYTATDQGGIVLIAGTGSNCRLVNPDGTEANCGGWGHMLGDEGSGYSIAWGAIKMVFDAQDNFGPSVADTQWLLGKVYEYFKIDKQFDILPALYSEFQKEFFAGFALVVAQGAALGDKACLKVLEKAGQQLGAHVVAVCPKIHKDLSKGVVTIVCTGSVWKSWEYIKGGFVAELESAPLCPSSYKLLQLSESAAVGAAFLGAKQEGTHIAIDFDANSTNIYTGGAQK